MSKIKKIYFLPLPFPFSQFSSPSTTSSISSLSTLVWVTVFCDEDHQFLGNDLLSVPRSRDCRGGTNFDTKKATTVSQEIPPVSVNQVLVCRPVWTLSPWNCPPRPELDLEISSSNRPDLNLVWTNARRNRRSCQTLVTDLMSPSSTTCPSL